MENNPQGIHQDNVTPEEINGNDFSLPKLLAVAAGVAFLTFGATKYFESAQENGAPSPLVKSSQSDFDAKKSLSRVGLEVVSQFTEDGINGYGALFQGQPVTAYQLPGSDKIIIGEMLSKHGTNLSQIHQQDHVIPEVGGRAWPHLEGSDYVIDQGKTDGPVLYTITDPNCPYCLRLWETLSPLVKAGDIQVRHLIVGILGDDSLQKAAAILEADNSSEILHAYQMARSNGDEYELPKPSQESIERVLENNETMRKAGASGTPASYAKYPDGSVEYISGAFTKEKAHAIIKKLNK